jgi:hypothetical protein
MFIGKVASYPSTSTNLKGDSCLLGVSHLHMFAILVLNNCSSFQTPYNFFKEQHNVPLGTLARILEIVSSNLGSETG